MRRIILIISAAVAMFLMSACCPKTEETFTLWQLPSQVNTIGNSYVIQTVNGKLIVMDGGSEEETEYLRGFISALGAEVEAWFFSHPHDDHFWALINILKEPRDIKINNIYHSRITPETIETENGLSNQQVKELYAMFDNSPEYKVHDCHAGDEFEIDGINFKILSEQNPEFKYYNNQSMVIKMWDDSNSFVRTFVTMIICGVDPLTYMMQAVYVMSKFTTVAVNRTFSYYLDIFRMVCQNKAERGTVPTLRGLKRIIVIRVSTA